MTVAGSLPEHIVGFTGVYDADGGVRGELTYVVGHLLGRTECALCDITHSVVRRKRSWDQAVAQLGVPFALIHRNEQDDQLDGLTAGQLPCVVAHGVDGTATVVLSGDALREVDGDVDAFFDLLISTLGAST